MKERETQRSEEELDILITPQQIIKFEQSDDSRKAIKLFASFSNDPNPISGSAWIESFETPGEYYGYDFDFAAPGCYDVAYEYAESSIMDQCGEVGLESKLGLAFWSVTAQGRRPPPYCF